MNNSNWHQHEKEREWQHFEKNRISIRKAGLLLAVVFTAGTLVHTYILYQAADWQTVMYGLAASVAFGASAANCYWGWHRARTQESWHAKMSIRKAMVFWSLIALFLLGGLFMMIAVTQ